jgi:hypothetical protein
MELLSGLGGGLQSDGKIAYTATCSSRNSLIRWTTYVVFV